MNLLAVVPVQARIALMIAFAVSLICFGWVKGASHATEKWEAADAVRVSAQAQAVQLRLASNARLAQKQADTNAAITKGKQDEIDALRARVDAAGRLHHGTAICGGPAPAAQTASATGGNSSDSSGGLVREDVDRDLKSLILAVETDLATGRACQKFTTDNGLAP